MKILQPNHIDPKRISTIVFDWGGVITNINFQLTIDAFKNLGVNSFDKFFSKYHQHSIFKQFEKGEVSTEEVYSEIRIHSRQSLSDADITDAWCAMLGNTPIERIELLRKLADNRSIYLLSNTNLIHTEEYLSYLKGLYGIDFRSLFNKVYYSHEVKMRKPDLEIFEFVLKDGNMQAGNTLYIDDTEINVEAAVKVGMQGLHITDELTIEDFFESWQE